MEPPSKGIWFNILKRKKKNEESRLCALHIDDSRWVRIPVSVILRRHFDMRVLEAASGQEGVHLAQTAAPDIIILDIVMPQMDGFDTLTELKANPLTKDIPVIMCTARNLAREVNMAVHLGAMGFLTKPIEEAALVDKVKDILGATGKGETIAQAVRTKQIPPDQQHDFVIPLEEPAAPPSKPDKAGSSTSNKHTAADRGCSFCHGALQFIEIYNAWYCYACRKYPELER